MQNIKHLGKMEFIMSDQLSDWFNPKAGGFCQEIYIWQLQVYIMTPNTPVSKSTQKLPLDTKPVFCIRYLSKGKIWKWKPDNIKSLNKCCAWRRIRGSPLQKRLSTSVLFRIGVIVLLIVGANNYANSLNSLKKLLS